MKLETFKSVILVFLVLLSLVLSFLLWNFQPKYGTLQSKYVSESDIGGKEVNKGDVIRPKSIIFHKNDEYYSFHQAKEKHEFFEGMFDWDYSDLSYTTPPRLDTVNEMIELKFPLDIQVNLLQHLLSIDEEEALARWSFNRVLIIPDKQLLSLDVYFLSKDGEQSLKLTVNNSEIYLDVMTPLNREHHLAKQIAFPTDEHVFYIPEKEVKMSKRSLTIEIIEPTLLVNALFRNPSLVSHTIGETNYNDGQRMMEVLNDGRSMEYTNPIELKKHLSFYDLFNTTINDINEHKGWTNTFILDEAEVNANRLQFRMYHDGYPIFSHEDYSMIEQRWEGQELYQYKRPLFKLTNLLSSEQVTLPSGKDVMSYLKENENYQLEHISDIRYGYRLIYEEGSFSVRLEPTWYIKYNERWTELTLDSPDALDKEEG
ncbi:MAG TPA: two-component system activity regulator YycH [Bacillota bacterium]|nr:two-component system activity regulator YycH [Bacillota bacterium]